MLSSLKVSIAFARSCFFGYASPQIGKRGFFLISLNVVVSSNFRTFDQATAAP